MGTISESFDSHCSHRRSISLISLGVVLLFLLSRLSQSAGVDWPTLSQWNSWHFHCCNHCYWRCWSLKLGSIPLLLRLWLRPWCLYCLYDNSPRFYHFCCSSFLVQRICCGHLVSQRTSKLRLQLSQHSCFALEPQCTRLGSRFDALKRSSLQYLYSLARYLSYDTYG